ncbi:translation initiation factor IF-2 [Aetokthonos hydrillicola Thurmond2011]|jgi:translation initiation factor IF-2|uniref:Translation initiation factor IF-2 n=1 Tax=Aetokthonos hydrillicola Thurmond2011 TaxID=2712845 RepID=A0AAP5M449_9CYAN|nr:translation initiation factor IF-2 [Aetokthonos hydrillicola]MBO3460823.1 translation initiation factor IF-2 [Aetokthonos hydrillicola CCALA 1050]MBW4585616.1 translation initiation factor IF-2 [Aetokthonos hydrillicola CCALA 1050]MDR9894516.1 translation initiation factor IF-2 [Aetokthonos hydrillicola Thurmond2011]
MNNGKVRIYELSKELNLDNKELLAICDQLNIAVKSHSSTITESEAERIRSQAEKLAAANMTPKKDNGGNSHRPNSPQPSGRNQPAAPNKQQILEIRKPKILRNNNHNASEASVATNNQLASSEVSSSPSPPRPFAPPVSPMKPTAPTRPVPRNQSETTQEPAVTDNNAAEITPATPTTPTTPTTPKNKQQEGKAAPEKTGTPHRARPDRPQKPHLAAPPTRPASEQSTDSDGQPSISERPILKRDREQTREQHKAKVSKPRDTETSQTPSPRPARSAGPPVKLDQRANKPSAPGQGVDMPRPRPPRPEQSPGVAASLNVTAPVKPAPPGTAKTEVLDEDDIAPPEILELKRPTPPRPSKTAKKWQEEEIDEVKESGKAGKGAVKGKRTKPIIEDDLLEDDFLDEEGLEIPATVQVSLSIARPPKPKAAKPAQPTTTTVSPTARVKKPGTSRDQNRRREPDQKQERPEKIVVMGPMTVQELADALAIADTEIVKILFIKGMAVSITQNLDVPTIKVIATDLEVEVETGEPEAEARKVTEMIDLADLEHLLRRPPVVTIMGHVDHGKTTLLDSIRKTKVAAGEAGGITQHIGAYHVDVEHDGKVQQVVFLDTPGHEAFTAMRARGARVTDIAVLVVAADDGVRPQTIEAISHAQAAEVPIVVAINKIDKEGAQPDRVKQELTQYGLTPEEWGGETIMVPVSAIKGENLDTLLEMILLVAEVAELSANPDRSAKGTVIEAHLDKAKGAVATLLIQNGTLHVGDMLVAGSAFGKVRAMVDDRGKRVEVASPSFAVEVLGLSDVPAAGDDFEVFENEKQARALASDRADKQRQSRLMQGRVTLTTISAQAQEGELKELNLILKADVQGSVEAIVGSLKQIPQNEVQIRMLLAAAGEITQTDIDLAAASGAVIIGFNTTYASGARQAADEAGVDVREYNIIYKLLEDIQGALEGLLEPELVEEPLGQAEVRAVFPVGRGAVAGCYIQSGKLLRNCRLRVRRSGKVIYEGVLDSLKRMKEDAREVSSGYECGVGVDKFNEWQDNDIIEAFQMVTKRRTLSMSK